VGAGDDAVKLAQLAASVPLGWRVENGQLVSPWSSIKDYRWVAENPSAAMRCQVTGRPALLAGGAAYVWAGAAARPGARDFDTPVIMR
jgi:hypothetical protein